ncbi:MAG: prepilin peptidase [Proteobacteria bacterium]|nr:prepilin peptidase [Pseudomonadota bacterium]
MLMEESTLIWVFAIFLFAMGACIGSFLNVVAYRLPLGISVVLPPSHCTECKSPVPVHGLIPVVGYFLVKRRCGACGASVSWHYALVEFLTAAGTVYLFFSALSPMQLIGAIWLEHPHSTAVGMTRFQPVVQMLTQLFLFYTAIPLTLIDLRWRILPDVITLNGALVAILLGAANVALGWQGALLGAVAGSGLLLFVAKTYEVLRGREGLGMGDVKYMALIGAVVGWQGVLIVLGLASILGSLVGIGIGLVKKEGLQASMPFGPFLAFAAIVVCLWQPYILKIFFGDY